MQVAPQGPDPTPARRPNRPDPAAVYSVPVDGSPTVGSDQARVTIVKAFEFACPYCDRVRPTLDQVRARYGDKVRIVYKNFIVHRNVAETPAYAACAAHRQGKFTEMYELIFDKGFNDGRKLDRAHMIKLARKLKLRIKQFKSDMDGEACAARVNNDQELLARLGNRGTPAFFINGRYLSGAQPLSRFESLIDEELAKADRAIAVGTTPVEYYEALVETGKKSM